MVRIYLESELQIYGDTQTIWVGLLFTGFKKVYAFSGRMWLNVLMGLSAYSLSEVNRFS